VAGYSERKDRTSLLRRNGRGDQKRGREKLRRFPLNSGGEVEGQGKRYEGEKRKYAKEDGAEKEPC